MLEVLNFTFSSFWIFIGVLMLIGLIGSMLIGLVAAMRGGNVNIF